MLDAAECDHARTGRDRAYDGRLFTGVRTTGVYCRPVCPVRPARSKNVGFFPSAVAAELAGFRPCLRCRPETAPFSPAWNGSLDGADASVGVPAARRGVGERQLTRLFTLHVGASPGQVARTASVQRAKRLIDTTNILLSEIAFAAGFGSLRPNLVFAEVYARPPTEVRRARAC